MGAPRVRRQPQRTCIACRRIADKRDLVRVVATPEGRILVDPRGKAPGRGAYLCRKRACWADARRSGVWRHALRFGGADDERVAGDLAAIDAYFAALPEDAGRQ